MLAIGFWRDRSFSIYMPLLNRQMLIAISEIL
jgi:hypothetical protein